MKSNVINRIRSYLRLQKSSKRVQQAQAQGLTELRFGPSSLNLMMTDACNSQCIMCGKDYQSCGTRQYISLADLKTIYDHLPMEQIVDVIYGGGGEPFLNPDLGRIAEHTKMHHPVVQHTVISNMIQWKRDMIAQMLDNQVHFLVSINAAGRETFRRVSGVDAFEAVVDHVGNLVSLRRETVSGSKISISMVLMQQNIGELPDFIDLAARLGVDEVKTLYVRVYPANHRTKLNREGTILPEDSLYYSQEKSDAIILAAEKAAQAKGISFDHEPLFSCSKTTERNCCEPWKSLFINFNGDVYPCPASEILFKPKVDSGQYHSGNILRQNYRDFWNNDFWRALRESNGKVGRKDIIPECLCCGNAIEWGGSGAREAHILDWRLAESSTLQK